MKLVIDTNIIFSAFLIQEPPALDIIMSEDHEIFYCQFVGIELFKHKEKILKYSGLSEERILDAYEMIISNSIAIHHNEIPAILYKEAEELCQDIDPKDTIFLAASMFIKGYLWTGDKKLRKGLAAKGFDHIITTDELLKKN